MSDTVLFVDDDVGVLEGIRRTLHGDFRTEFANGPESGLSAIRERGPFAVIVSDMRMPGMDGAEFLKTAQTLTPLSVRMILSGQSDLRQAIAAVNEGAIFRFLTKPCPREILVKALQIGLEHYRLATAERDLLEQTLSGAVTVLTEILGIVNPRAIGRAMRLRHYVDHVASLLDLPERWQFRLAAMLSQIGYVSFPSETLARLEQGHELSREEKGLLDRHDELSGKLLSNIPRLEAVSRMIHGQRQPIDLTALPEDVKDWELDVLGAQVLRMTTTFDEMMVQGMSHDDAHRRLTAMGFPPKWVSALDNVPGVPGATHEREVRASDLRLGMILEEEVRTKSGLLLIPSGQEITHSLLVRLRTFAETVGIVEPCRVSLPGHGADDRKGAPASVRTR